jgi:hypothetical protein
VPKGEHLVEDLLAIITRSVKVNFPKFDANPSGWIYKANKFFYHHRTPYNQRLILASIHMEGKALVWYQDMDMSGYLPNWTVLTQSLMQRFGPSTYDDPMESLARLRQLSSVDEYKKRFEALSNRVKGCDDMNKLSCFLGGLKEEIHLPIKMFNPPTLLIAYGLAKMQEEHVLSARRFRSPNLNFPNSSAQRFGGGHSSQQGVISQKLVIHVQKISQAQMEERRKKGLCYNCDSKWQFGHKCQTPKLFLINFVEWKEGQIVVEEHGDVLMEFTNGEVVPEISFLFMLLLVAYILKQ